MVQSRASVLDREQVPEAQVKIIHISDFEMLKMYSEIDSMYQQMYRILTTHYFFHPLAFYNDFCSDVDKILKIFDQSKVIFCPTSSFDIISLKVFLNSHTEASDDAVTVQINWETKTCLFISKLSTNINSNLSQPLSG